MFRWSSALHSIVYRLTTTAHAGKHPTDWNTTVQYASIQLSVTVENPHFVQQNTRTIAVDQARFPLVSEEEISTLNTSETAASKKHRTSNLNMDGNMGRTV